MPDEAMTPARWRKALDRALKEGGTLKLITPFRREGKEDADPRDPATFVWEDVTRISKHPYKGHLLRAYTAEGSDIDGEPQALFHRLREWQTYAEERQREAELAERDRRYLDDLDERER